jgi:WhiB family redox-sensing transcriptional regulator
VTALDSLLLAMAGAPALVGARCRGKGHLFDGPTIGEPTEVMNARHAQALGLCTHCPALQRCREWYSTLTPRKRPEGVVAGLVNMPTRGRPKAVGR